MFKYLLFSKKICYYIIVKNKHISMSIMEENNDAHGYLKLGKSRKRNDFNLTHEFSNLPPPVDKFNFVYLSFILAGIGFLLPYNRYVIRHFFYDVHVFVINNVFVLVL